MATNLISSILLLLALSTLVGSQEPVETQFSSNVSSKEAINCDSKVAVCVGPLMYMDCVGEAKGQIYQCPKNSRCVNDGIQICVPIKIPTDSTTSKGILNTTSPATEGPTSTSQSVASSTTDLYKSQDESTTSSTTTEKISNSHLESFHTLKETGQYPEEKTLSTLDPELAFEPSVDAAGTTVKEEMLSLETTTVSFENAVIIEKDYNTDITIDSTPASNTLEPSVASDNINESYSVTENTQSTRYDNFDDQTNAPNTYDPKYTKTTEANGHNFVSNEKTTVSFDNAVIIEHEYNTDVTSDSTPATETVGLDVTEMAQSTIYDNFDDQTNFPNTDDPKYIITTKGNGHNLASNEPTVAQRPASLPTSQDDLNDLPAQSNTPMVPGNSNLFNVIPNISTNSHVPDLQTLESKSNSSINQILPLEHEAVTANELGIANKGNEPNTLVTSIPSSNGSAGSKENASADPNTLDNPDVGSSSVDSHIPDIEDTKNTPVNPNTSLSMESDQNTPLNSKPLSNLEINSVGADIGTSETDSTVIANSNMSVDLISPIVSNTSTSTNTSPGPSLLTKPSISSHHISQAASSVTLNTSLNLSDPNPVINPRDSAIANTSADPGPSNPTTLDLMSTSRHPSAPSGTRLSESANPNVSPSLNTLNYASDTSGLSVSTTSGPTARDLMSSSRHPSAPSGTRLSESANPNASPSLNTLNYASDTSGLSASKSTDPIASVLMNTSPYPTAPSGTRPSESANLNASPITSGIDVGQNVSSNTDNPNAAINPSESAMSGTALVNSSVSADHNDSPGDRSPPSNRSTSTEPSAPVNLSAPDSSQSSLDPISSVNPSETDSSNGLSNSTAPDAQNSLDQNIGSVSSNSSINSNASATTAAPSAKAGHIAQNSSGNSNKSPGANEFNESTSVEDKTKEETNNKVQDGIKRKDHGKEKTKKEKVRNEEKENKNKKPKVENGESHERESEEVEGKEDKKEKNKEDESNENSHEHNKERKHKKKKEKKNKKRNIKVVEGDESNDKSESKENSIENEKEAECKKKKQKHKKKHQLRDENRDKNDSNEKSHEEKLNEQQEELIQNIIKKLEGKNCETGIILPDLTNCKKYYRCLETSGETNFVHFHCEHKKRFDFTDGKCVKKNKAQCLLKRD